MPQFRRWRSWWKTVWTDQRGMSDYVALAIATPLMIMGFLGGAAVVETVSAQAALHTAAGIADRSLVADGCLTSNALQAMSTTLQAAHMSPSRMTLATTTGSSGLYGTRGLAVNVSYAVPLTIPGTPWRVTSRQATAQVSDDQSQYVPYANTRTSACASSSAVASVFQGESGSSSGGSSVTLPPEATAISETVTPSPGQVGSALTVSGTVTDNGSPMANTAVSVAVGTQVTQTATTNAQGQYSATLIPTHAGTVAVDVTAGPATNQQTVTIHPLAPASVTLNVPPSLAVGQAFAIQGTVLAANGQPVADGTSVTVSSNASSDIPTQTVTTTGGAFTVDVPNGLTALSPNPVTVTATAGSVQQTASMTPEPGAPQAVTWSVTPAKDTAGSTWTVSGTVTGPDQTPVASGTTVTLSDSVANASTLPTFTTSSTGAFSGTLTLTTAGAQSLTATAGTVQSAPVSVTVTPGAPTQVENLTATPNPVNLGATTVISGTVLDAYGNPEPAGLTLTLSSTAWKTPVTTTTAAGGTFSTAVSFNRSGNQVVQVAVGSTPLQNGTIPVAVNAQGAYTLTATQSATTMTAGTSTSVTWTLTDSQGNPVAGIPLALAANPTTNVTLSASSATTNSAGQATITVATTQAGTLTVTATAQTSPNTTGTATWIVNPAVPAAVDPPTISPSTVQSTTTGGTTDPVLSGIALDSYGNAIAHATVSVVGGWDAGKTFTGTTDADGYFSIPLTPVDVGGPYHPTITVTDAAGSQTATYSNAPLTVTGQPSDQITLQAISGTSTAMTGTPFSVLATVTQNGVVDNNVTVTFSSPSNPGATWSSVDPSGPTGTDTGSLDQLSGTYAPGQAAAAASFTAGGQQTVQATALGQTVTLPIMVGSDQAVQAWVLSTSPNPDPAGTPETVTGQIVNQVGAVVDTGESVTVTAQGPTTATATGAINSQGDWSVTFVPSHNGITTAGTYTLSVAVNGQPVDITMGPTTVTVSPGPLAYVYPLLGSSGSSGTNPGLPNASWTQPASDASTQTNAYGAEDVTPGTAFAVRIIGYDAYGNVVPGATATAQCAVANGSGCPNVPQTVTTSWQNTGGTGIGAYTLTLTPASPTVSAQAVPTMLTWFVPQGYFYADSQSTQTIWIGSQLGTTVQWQDTGNEGMSAGGDGGLGSSATQPVVFGQDGFTWVSAAASPGQVNWTEPYFPGEDAFENSYGPPVVWSPDGLPPTVLVASDYLSFFMTNTGAATYPSLGTLTCRVRNSNGNGYHDETQDQYYPPELLGTSPGHHHVVALASQGACFDLTNGGTYVEVAEGSSWVVGPGGFMPPSSGFDSTQGLVWDGSLGQWLVGTSWSWPGTTSEGVESDLYSTQNGWDDPVTNTTQEVTGGQYDPVNGWTYVTVTTASGTTGEAALAPGSTTFSSYSGPLPFAYANASNVPATDWGEENGLLYVMTGGDPVWQPMSMPNGLSLSKNDEWDSGSPNDTDSGVTWVANS